MNIKNISDRVIYCGVNDRTTDLFEGLWDLPLGVSYNSYIVKGSEASAIIDASDSGHAPEYLRHIEDTLDGRNPDYLVINHIEPDHSGVLPMLLDRYPDLQIVGNANEVLSMILKLKPSAAKGSYVKSIYLSTTMSPGLQIDSKSVETK